MAASAASGPTGTWIANRCDHEWRSPSAVSAHWGYVPRRPGPAKGRELSDQGLRLPSLRPGPPVSDLSPYRAPTGNRWIGRAFPPMSWARYAVFYMLCLLSDSC